MRIESCLKQIYNEQQVMLNTPGSESVSVSTGHCISGELAYPEAVFDNSQIMNLCCARSIRTVWESAAPVQITLPYILKSSERWPNRRTSMRPYRIWSLSLQSQTIELEDQGFDSPC